MKIGAEFNMAAADRSAEYGQLLLKELATPRDGRNGNLLLAERVAKLLKDGADIHARDAEGRTPLMWAAFHCRVILLNHLIAMGADLHARDNGGNSALDLARQKKQKPAIKSLEAALKEQLEKDLENMSVTIPVRIFKSPLRVKRKNR